MPDFELDRRAMIATSAALAAGAALSSQAASAADAPLSVAGPAPYAPQPVPLPFDPKTIAGLSEKLLVSHHDNNYAGAVKRLGAIDAQLHGLDPATVQGFLLNGLKREQLIAWNSMVFHEIYFSQFGQPNQPGAALAAAIAREFGSLAIWQAKFATMGKALGGGSGWVVLTYSHRDGRLVNQWAADHTMALAGGSPLLVLDMYEHAYAMDYGAKAAAYVDAVMAVLDWRAADARFARASRA
jgi:superoxide dismutase, Fe-Mn family